MATRFIGLRIPVPLAKELRAWAAEQDLSLSELVRRLAVRMLEQDQERLRKLQRKHTINRPMAERH